jgi:hypothetical protein
VNGAMLGDTLRVFGLKIPLPQSLQHRNDERASGRVEVSGRFEPRRAAAYLAAIERWARDAGARRVSALGEAGGLGFSRLWEVGDASVQISVGTHPPGAPALLMVYVERRTELPRTLIHDGCVDEDVRIPVPPGCAPQELEDLTEDGGAREHHLVAPRGLTLAEIVRFYEHWAAREGWTLAEQVDSDDRTALFYARGVMRVGVSTWPGPDGHALTIAVRVSGDQSA